MPGLGCEAFVGGISTKVRIDPSFGGERSGGNSQNYGRDHVMLLLTLVGSG
jgi:hypothetical protein